MRKRHSTARFVLTLAAVLAVSACARGEADSPVAGVTTKAAPASDELASCAPATPRSHGDGPAPNWDLPEFAGAKRVKDTEEARSYLRFDPVEPRNLGEPIGVFVPTDKPVQSAGGMAYIFHHPDYGRFQIQETRPGDPAARQQQIERETSRNADPATPVKVKIVKVRDTIRAAVTSSCPRFEGHVKTSIRWVERGVSITVIGPSDTFGEQEAIAVAGGF